MRKRRHVLKREMEKGSTRIQVPFVGRIEAGSLVIAELVGLRTPFCTIDDVGGVPPSDAADHDSAG